MNKVVKYAAKKTDMVKIGESEAKSKWYWMSPAVEKYAKAQIPVGTEVELQTETKNGKDVITRITKEGNSSSTPQTNKDEPQGFTCKECGAALKDDKYDTCYDCNQKNKKSGKSNYYSKSPAEREMIKRQAMGHMVSRTLISLQGHVDPNNVEELATSLYKLYENLVGEIN